jgi:hypothetical protein
MKEGRAIKSTPEEIKNTNQKLSKFSLLRYSHEVFPQIYSPTTVRRATKEGYHLNQNTSKIQDSDTTSSAKAHK